jgi:hypothetical protein
VNDDFEVNGHIFTNTPSRLECTCGEYQRSYEYRSEFAARHSHEIVQSKLDELLEAVKYRLKSAKGRGRAELIGLLEECGYKDIIREVGAEDYAF